MQPAHEIAAAVREGAISPVEVLDAAVARIDAVEPEVRAWVQLDRAGARRRAEELARAQQHGDALGPLAGVPVGIKDIVDVAGLPTRAGAPPFAHYNPANDSAVVARPNLIAHFPPRLDLKIGDTIPLAIDTAGLHFFDKQTGAALR